jgi:hypothetical protein
VNTFLWVGLVVAVSSAARSTWSPCGLSMLSSITPFGERARRHRYGVTAGWFVAGSVAGGLTLGAAGAALALLVTAFAVPPLLYVGVAAAIVGAAVDAGTFGAVLPLIRRQVDDGWLAQYRPWVYGAGFGWQIGVGLATYLMTAGVVLVLVFGALSGSPAVALLLGAGFGLARGSTVLLTAKATDPARLRLLHARLDRVGPSVRRAAVGVQIGSAVGLVLTATGTVGGPGAAVVAVAGALVAVAGARVAAAGAGVVSAAWAGRRPQPVAAAGPGRRPQPVAAVHEPVSGR